MYHDIMTYLYHRCIGCGYSSVCKPKEMANMSDTRELHGPLWNLLFNIITCTFRSGNWELLPDALYSIGSLLCRATNETPDEQLLIHKRRSSLGESRPTQFTRSCALATRRC